MTAFVQIQAAIVGALLQAPALADGRVHSNRMRPVAQQHSSYIVVRTDECVATEAVLGYYDWQTVYVVEVYARAASGAADPIETVDALLAQVWERLAAAAPTGLGVMQLVPRPAVDWQSQDLDTTVACAVLRFVARHRTPINSLEPAP